MTSSMHSSAGTSSTCLLRCRNRRACSPSSGTNGTVRSSHIRRRRRFPVDEFQVGMVYKHWLSLPKTLSPAKSPRWCVDSVAKTRAQNPNARYGNSRPERCCSLHRFDEWKEVGGWQSRPAGTRASVYDPLRHKTWPRGTVTSHPSVPNRRTARSIKPAGVEESTVARQLLVRRARPGPRSVVTSTRLNTRRAGRNSRSQCSRLSIEGGHKKGHSDNVARKLCLQLVDVLPER